MRTHFVLLTALTALIGATPASAATPVLGPADGVQATRTDTTLVVTFTGDPAKWAPLVGQELAVVCTPASNTTGLLFTGDSPLGADDVEAGSAKVGADGTLRSTLRTKKPLSSCALTGVGKQGTAVLVAQAALDPSGEAWLDESVRATGLRDLLERAAGSHGYRPLAALGAGLVAQDGPTGTPGPGETGYWTDGGWHAVASTTSAAGRRLVIEDFGDGMLRTNVLLQAAVLQVMLGVMLEGGSISSATDNEGRPSPYRGKAVNARDGVRGRFAGKRLTVRFTGRSAAAIHKVAGRRVEVHCVVHPPHALFGEPSRRLISHSSVVRVPRRGATLTATLPGIGDLCRIADDGKSVALVSATDSGRRWWADLQAIELFDRLPDSLAAPGGQKYLAPAEAVVGRKGVVTMAGPDAAPPVGRVGVWTDGAARAVAAVKSAFGRRIVMVDEGGGMLRTNVFGDFTGMLMLEF